MLSIVELDGYKEPTIWINKLQQYVPELLDCEFYVYACGSRYIGNYDLYSDWDLCSDYDYNKLEIVKSWGWKILNCNDETFKKYGEITKTIVCEKKFDEVKFHLLLVQKLHDYLNIIKAMREQCDFCEWPKEFRNVVWEILNKSGVLDA